jgi:hypothetical protein
VRSISSKSPDTTGNTLEATTDEDGQQKQTHAQTATAREGYASYDAWDEGNDGGSSNDSSSSATNGNADAKLPSGVDGAAAAFMASDRQRMHPAVMTAAMPPTRPTSSTTSQSRDAGLNILAAGVPQVGGTGPGKLYRTSSQPISRGVSGRHAGSGFRSPRQQQQQQQQQRLKSKKHSSRSKHRLGKGGLRNGLGSRAGRLQPVIRRSQSTNSLKHLAMQFAQDALYTQNEK